MPWMRGSYLFHDKLKEELTNEQIEKAREARKGINPIGFCGIHCDFCSFSMKCGGCRSDYNSCSLEGLEEHNGICSNIICAKEKNLTGCCECHDLLVCKKGFYKEKRSAFAKAFALFIRKYGEKCFSKTIANIRNEGNLIDYIFMAKSGNVNNKIKLLEEYIVRGKGINLLTIKSLSEFERMLEIAINLINSKKLSVYWQMCDEKEGKKYAKIKSENEIQIFKIGLDKIKSNKNEPSFSIEFCVGLCSTEFWDNLKNLGGTTGKYYSEVVFSYVIHDKISYINFPLKDEYLKHFHDENIGKEAQIDLLVEFMDEVLGKM